ncbi:hypothetical protein [Bradyrhizobium sp. CCBAU 051011]|uniref:hypothetical protein n=1 Tax=Bradyrhizobium sp. CCBAU 051011 TaxID=858422 RepID=UPI00137AFF99|nr:hypothetical protein [Bradyrhizobium sp. CCBAU 051011]
MVIVVPELTGYATLRHIEVSLAHVPALVDGVKYMEPRDVPRLEGTELRRARAPSLRFLVKLALKCDNAEELGKRLRQRYEHAYPPSRREQAAVDWRLAD